MDRCDYFIRSCCSGEEGDGAACATQGWFGQVII